MKQQFIKYHAIIFHDQELICKKLWIMYCQMGDESDVATEWVADKEDNSDENMQNEWTVQVDQIFMKTKSHFTETVKNKTFMWYNNYTTKQYEPTRKEKWTIYKESVVFKRCVVTS